MENAEGDVEKAAVDKKVNDINIYISKRIFIA